MLDLARSRFTSDTALQDLGCLTRLKYLNIYRCQGLKRNSFDHICLCPVLRTLVFSPDICATMLSGQAIIIPDQKVGNLNNMTSLKFVHVHAVTNTATGILRSLCRGDAQWMMKFKQLDSVTDTYILSR